MMRTACVLVCWVLLVPTVAHSEDLNNAQVAVTDLITLLGYPTKLEVSNIQAEDALVVDLRLPEEMLDGQPSLAVHGIRSINIPIGRDPLRNETVARFKTVLKRAGSQRIYVHCSSGNRAALLWAALQISEGRDVDEILHTVRAVATKPETVDAIRAFANRNRSSR